MRRGTKEGGTTVEGRSWPGPCLFSTKVESSLISFRGMPLMVLAEENAMGKIVDAPDGQTLELPAVGRIAFESMEGFRLFMVYEG